MGGCRCTYRNCTIRTDGVTHMFHYPVFDKVRCHQWLTNAQKLNFLNLKVSQLKNRVVCQHHFQDENFMNFKKDKLTFDAVPTEDGPFCDLRQLYIQNNVEDIAKEFPISQEDIENEFLTLKEKEANFSVKYGDFLTNCELMDLNSQYQNNDGNTQVKHKNKSFEDTGCNIVLPESKAYVNNSESVSANSTDNFNNNKFNSQPMLVVPPYYTFSVQDPSVFSIEIEKLQHQKKHADILNPISKFPQQTSKLLKPNISEDKGIRIISVKNMSELLPVKGTLEPVSPSLVLQLPKKNNCEKSNEPKTVNNCKTNIKYEIYEEKNKAMEQQHVPPSIKDVPKSKSNTLNNNVSPKSKSVLKNNMPAERIAAIEEKRKFNMKLRDIVETCLDKLDEPERVSNDKRLEHNSKISSPKVSTFLSHEPETPSSQENTITCIEARIKKMEDNLLSKIDQNSHRIIDLKKSLLPLTGKAKKSTFTQTFNNDESHKKHLYQEISKYLSPEANSLIYEELFINKYSQKVPKITPSPKRRKRR